MAQADYISFRYKFILDGNNELDLKLLVGINTFYSIFISKHVTFSINSKI